MNAEAIELLQSIDLALDIIVFILGVLCAVTILEIIFG